jgi:Ion channel
MYENWLANAVVISATLAAVSICVLAHYEGLIFVSRGLARLHARHQRIKVLYAITSVLILHVLEIWVFGIALWLLLRWPETGQLAGQPTVHLFDAIYLSAMTYTTVGYGDVTPVGPVRFLAGTEALTGFVLITWSASFTYLEMARFWRRP